MEQQSREVGVDRSQAPAPLLAMFGDAAFLACSWTWCIGMFLPMMLMRDMGVASFAVFAIPNCLGAAALAWWMRSKSASYGFVQTHLHAMRTFSLVTIAFQWFFFAWAAAGLGLSVSGLIMLAGLLAPLLMFPSFLSDDGRRRAFSIATWVASVALLTYFVVTSGAVEKLQTLPTPMRNPEHVWPLLSVCVLGFVCSPLLDGTFHTIKQRSESDQARPEFALGFLVLFAMMIGGTLLYGAWLIVDNTKNGTTDFRYLAPINLPLMVLLHIALQLGFTIAAHERWNRGQRGSHTGFGASVPIVGAIVGMVLGAFGPALVGALNIDTVALAMLPNELVYRCFMAFYGLLVPLYVLGCCLAFGPFSPATAGPSLARIAALVATASIATPFYYRGFILRETQWLWYGVAIAVVGGVIARFLPGPKSARA